MRNMSQLAQWAAALIVGFSALVSLAGHGLDPAAMWTAVLACGYSSWTLLGWALKSTKH